MSSKLVGNLQPTIVRRQEWSFNSFKKTLNVLSSLLAKINGDGSYYKLCLLCYNSEWLSKASRIEFWLSLVGIKNYAAAGSTLSVFYSMIGFLGKYDKNDLLSFVRFHLCMNLCSFVVDCFEFIRKDKNFSEIMNLFVFIMLWEIRMSHK